VGDRGVFRVCPAARERQAVWGESGSDALGDGQKHTLTTTYMQFLAVWARRLPWTAVARISQTSWEKVFHSVEWMVEWGLKHRKLTLVYKIDGHCQRSLWVWKDRTVKKPLDFFRGLGPERSARLRFICSNPRKPYLKVIVPKAGPALHILDRFHVMQHMNYEQGGR